MPGLPAGWKAVSGQALGRTGDRNNVFFFITGNCDPSGVLMHTFTERNWLCSSAHPGPSPCRREPSGSVAYAITGPRTPGLWHTWQRWLWGRQKRHKYAQQQVAKPHPGPPGAWAPPWSIRRGWAAGQRSLCRRTFIALSTSPFAHLWGRDATLHPARLTGSARHSTFNKNTYHVPGPKVTGEKLG